MDEASGSCVEIERLRRRVEELEALQHRTRDFTATAFHDLQEPLRKIGAFTDLLEQAILREDRTEADYALGVLRRSSRQVQQLVRDILAYSRSTRTDLAREPVPLRAVVDEVLSAVSGTVVETSAIMKVQIEPATVSADRLQLYHLVVNLVSNSLKFFPAGTEPYVELTGRRDGAGRVRLAVVDHGIGFDLSQARAIFDPFRRLNSRAVFTGSGLGLSICRSIVDRHGWTIDVESAPGAGASFAITIPASDVIA